MIEALAREARPVRRLASPGRRVVRWLIVALPVIAVFGMVMGLRPDLTEMLAEPVFLMQLAAGLVTAVAAAHAAFASSIPAAPRWMLWLPAAPLGV